MHICTSKLNRVCTSKLHVNHVCTSELNHVCTSKLHVNRVCTSKLHVNRVGLELTVLILLQVECDMILTRQHRRENLSQTTTPTA